MSVVGWIGEKRGNISMVADRRVYAEKKSRPVDVRRPCVHSISAYIAQTAYLHASTRVVEPVGYASTCCMQTAMKGRR